MTTSTNITGWLLLVKTHREQFHERRSQTRERKTIRESFTLTLQKIKTQSV